MVERKRNENNTHTDNVALTAQKMLGFQRRQEQTQHHAEDVLGRYILSVVMVIAGARLSSPAP